MTIQFKDIEDCVEHISVGPNNEGGLELSIVFKDNLTDESQDKIKEFVVEVYQKQTKEVVKQIAERAEEINARTAFSQRTLGMTN